jgi:hypothetical protein
VDHPSVEDKVEPQATMHHEDVDLTPHPLVARLLADPASPPDTVVLNGYLGASQNEKFVRLYLGLDFRAFIDIPRMDIVYAEPSDPSNLAKPSKVVVHANTDQMSIHQDRLSSISVPGKSAHPLKHPINLKVFEEPTQVTVHVAHPDLEGELLGHGPTLESSMYDLGRRFDRSVQHNRAVPPHAMTAENMRVVQGIDRLVDWEKYEKDNPLTQPMWGQVLSKRVDGSLRIHWIIGPNGARDAEALLPSRDVPSALDEIDVGHWFYGTAKCFPDRIEWVDPPLDAPDPEDPVARAQLWDQLDVEFTDEPGCWPARQS